MSWTHKWDNYWQQTSYCGRRKRNKNFHNHVIYYIIVRYIVVRLFYIVFIAINSRKEKRYCEPRKEKGNKTQINEKMSNAAKSYYASKEIWNEREYSCILNTWFAIHSLILYEAKRRAKCYFCVDVERRSIQGFFGILMKIEEFSTIWFICA